LKTPVSLFVLSPLLAIALNAQSQLKLDSGKEIYQAACAGCHGTDGRGQPQTVLGFNPPATFPDFADCPTATPEPDIQWWAVIVNGGHARAFSPIMAVVQGFVDQGSKSGK
jgi:mono/diheme cytochrome c family protein